MGPPLGQSLLEQGRIERLDLKARMLQSPRKAPLGTLGIPGSPAYKGHPGPQTHTARVDKTHHPPGQSMDDAHHATAQVDPITPPVHYERRGVLSIIHLS